MSPTARTLTHMRKTGWTIGVVEKWIPQMKRRVDLFGCIDLCAVKAGNPGVLGVQSTSSTNVAARVTKALAEPRLRVWLLAGNRFVVHGWAMRGKAGARKLWTLTEREVTLSQYDAANLTQTPKPSPKPAPSAILAPSGAAWNQL